MNTRKILLAIVLGFLLLQFAAALDSKAAKDTKDAVKGAKETVNAAAKDLKDTIKEAAKDAKANVQDKKETAKEAVKEAAKDTKDKAETVKETVKATANDAKEAIKTNAAGAKESVKETAKATKENVKEAAKDAKETIKQATKDTKETVKEATKEATQKVKETASKIKEEATKEAASLVDTYLPIIQGYVKQVTELTQEYTKVAAEYGGVAWKEAKKYGGSAAVQAQEYSAAFVAAVSEYKAQLGAYTYAHAVEIVDKFFDPQHAALIKKNFLNYYGVAVLIGSIVGLYLVVKHLKWMLSPKALQLFISAVSLGIYLTLTALTILTSKDPTSAIPASSLASIQSGLFYLTIATTAVNVVAFFIYSGRQKSFVVALLSVGLFVEELELRSVIEGAMGTIPDYSLHALVYLLQSALIFDSISSTYSPVVAKVKVSPSSSSVKSQEIKVEKTEKGKKSKAK